MDVDSVIRTDALINNSSAGQEGDGVPAAEFLRHVRFLTRNQHRVPPETFSALSSYAATVEHALRAAADVRVPQIVAHIARSNAERLGFEATSLFNDY